MIDTTARGLAADGVVMSFGGVDALKEVTLGARPGDWLGLIGPNGSGKTTMLNVLSGLYRPRAGTVRLDGTDLTRLAPAARSALGVVRTFQHPQLARSLTLRENVLVGARLGGGGRAGAERRADEVLDRFACARWAHTLPEEAPYGVRKIVEVARAAATGPRVVLLDEPAAGLSTEERVELSAALQTFRATHAETIVCLVEHDVPFVTRLCPTLAVLNAGSLVAHDDSTTVLTDPAVREAYLGPDRHSEGSSTHA
ncbi:ABC transporter ATP-binding protein [Pseudonocardia sp. RS010]|uniref:ABC transporter ATP-binding protein n=1 Tax=Pseudonocardia sp. RS010 TaxID=3385979 RepID=UPI0039A10EA7